MSKYIYEKYINQAYRKKRLKGIKRRQVNRIVITRQLMPARRKERGGRQRNMRKHEGSEKDD